MSIGVDGQLPPEGADAVKNAIGNVPNVGKVPGSPSPSGDVGTKSQVSILINACCFPLCCSPRLINYKLSYYYYQDH